MTTIALILLFAIAIAVAAKFVLSSGSGESKGNQDAESSGSNEESSFSTIESEASAQGKKELERAMKKAVGDRLQVEDLHKLPVFQEDFIGRKNILRELNTLVKSAPLRVGLCGPAGSGKTALALAFVRTLFTKFRDDQLYFDMRGTTANPLAPRDVMARLIHLYRPTEILPVNDQELVRLYKIVLKNKKIALLLDNVPNTDAVKKLVPPKHCGLIFTSNEALQLSGVESRKPGPLSPDDSNLLIQGISVRIGYWGGEIAKLCENQPLGLILAARYISAHPHSDTEAYLESLRREIKGPKDAPAKKTKSPIDAVIKISYQKLDEPTAAVLQKITLFLDRFDSKAEAFVCEDKNNEQLGYLLLNGLIMTDKETNRYFLHDQVRKFLLPRVNKSAMILARKRLATYYLTLLLTARDLFDTGGKERIRGLRLFDMEWENIQAGQAWAEEFSQKDSEADKLCLSFTEAGLPILVVRHPPTLCIRWFEAALESAKRQGDGEAETRYLLEIGRQYNKLTQHQRALESLEEAMTRYREAEDTMGEREALGHLGLTYQALGKPHQAIELLEKELSLIQESDDKKNQENVLQRLGQIYHQVGENLKALEYYHEELSLARESEDPRRQGRVLGDLGELHTILKDHDSAIESFQEALKLVRKIGDKSGEIRLYQHLGDAQMKTGKPQKAISFYESGLALAAEKGEPASEAQLKVQMGEANLVWEKLGEAVECFEQAANLFQNLGNRRKEGETLWSLSQALEKSEKTDKAEQCGKKALTLLKEVNHPQRTQVEEALKRWAHPQPEKAPPSAPPQETPAPPAAEETKDSSAG